VETKIGAKVGAILPLFTTGVIQFMRRELTDDTPSFKIHALAVGAQSIGALVLGAMAVGAVAIGAVAIGKLAIGRVRIKHLEIDELTVRKLRVSEELETPVQQMGGA